MKYLIYNNKLFYLSDETSKKNGQSRSISGYNAETITKSNMPHQYFNKKIIIYGRHSCPYCVGILDFLKSKPLLNKKAIFVDMESGPDEFFSYINLLKILNVNEPTFNKQHKTVPIVFDKGIFIGGADASQIYFDKNTE